MNIRLLIIGAMVAMAINLSAADAPEVQLRKGKELAADVIAIRPQKDSQIRGIFHVWKKGSNTTNDVPVVCRINVSGDTWESVYEIIPTETAPREKLIIRHVSQKPNEYFYAKANASWVDLPELKKLSPAEANISLAGSDFWLTDLGLDFLHWPEQRRIKGEYRLGQFCHVLESSNPNAKDVVRIKSWIEGDTGGILAAEAYDAKGELVKEFSLSGSSFKKVNGQMQIESIKLNNVKTGSKTVLQFELPKDT